MEQSETDVFVSLLEGIQRRGGRRQRAETHFCVHPSKSRHNRNFFMAGSCTAEANKAKPDGERLRQLRDKCLDSGEQHEIGQTLVSDTNMQIVEAAPLSSPLKTAAGKMRLPYSTLEFYLIPLISAYF